MALHRLFAFLCLIDFEARKPGPAGARSPNSRVPDAARRISIAQESSRLVSSAVTSQSAVDIPVRRIRKAPGPAAACKAAPGQSPGPAIAGSPGHRGRVRPQAAPGPSSSPHQQRSARLLQKLQQRIRRKTGRYGLRYGPGSSLVGKLRLPPPAFPFAGLAGGAAFVLRSVF